MDTKRDRIELSLEQKYQVLIEKNRLLEDQIYFLNDKHERLTNQVTIITATLSFWMIALMLVDIMM